jgi:hypothetical protein
MPRLSPDKYIAAIEASTAGLRRSWLNAIGVCRSPPARNAHCVRLSRTLAERTDGRPRSRVRGLQYSFRSVRYRMAGSRMIPPSSAGGYGPLATPDRR